MMIWSVIAKKTALTTEMKYKTAMVSPIEALYNVRHSCFE